MPIRRGMSLKPVTLETILERHRDLKFRGVTLFLPIYDSYERACIDVGAENVEPIEEDAE